MSTRNALHLPSSPVGIGLFGCWTLPQRSAVTLDAERPGYLRVAQGSFWATLDGPHQGPANDWGDLVLKSGTRIKLTPGQHVVLEPYGDAANEPASFSWEPEAEAQGEAAARRRSLQRVGAWLLATGRTVANWFAPAPNWPLDVHAMRRDAFDDAWRRLNYLRSNQP